MKKQVSQLKIGILLNYVNLAISGLIPLLYTPIMLSILGKEEYGLYKLSSSVTSYLGLIAFGLGSAITRYLIKARTEQGEEEERKVLGFFIRIFRVVAAVMLVVGIGLSLCVPMLYSHSLTGDELEKMKLLVLLLSCNTAINFLASPYISVVNAHERFLFLQSMAIVGTCLGPLLNLIALYLGYASMGLAVTSLVATIVFRLCFYFYVQRTMHITPLHRRMPMCYVKEVFVFSFWIFVSNIVGQLYEATDMVLIGAVPALATSGVAVYNIGMTFNSMIFTINAGVSSLLLPKANKMVFSGATSYELTDTAIRMGRIQAIIISLFISGFIVFGRPFIHFYVGDDYLVSYWIAVVCMIPASVPLVQSFCLNIVIARNENRFRALTYLVIAIFNVIATWYAMKWIGVFGAALATSVASLLGPGVLMNWFYKTKVKLQIARFWLSMVKIFLPVFVLTMCFLASSVVINYYNIVALICGILVFTLVFVFVTWNVTMDKYEKELVKSVIHIKH